MICIYHSKDLDGWMSAAIVKLKYPEVKLIGWNYGDPVHPTSNIGDEQVIMVDISFLPEVMLNLTRNNNLIWIDHHVRTIKETEDYIFPNPLPRGLRYFKFAACELTWKYLFPDQKMPELVRLLGRYDCFGHKGTEEEQKVLEFQFGARQNITNPEEALRVLRDYLESDYQAMSLIETIHFEGKAIYKYLCTEAKQIYAKKFDVKFIESIDDIHIVRKFACVNTERFNPVNFGIDYHKDGYDGFASFYYENKKWNFSFYNDNGEVDCSAIAKRFGGGGHKGAAGVRVEDLDTVLVGYR